MVTVQSFLVMESPQRTQLQATVAIKETLVTVYFRLVLSTNTKSYNKLEVVRMETFGKSSAKLITRFLF